MQSFRSCALWATLLVPAALFGQTVTTSGVVSVAAGGALLEGDRAAYQQMLQHRKDVMGGLEEFHVTREGEDDIFKFDARVLPFDYDYRLALRYEKTEKFYVDAGFEQFRVWYDGSGGVFRPRDVKFTLFEEDLGLDRSKAWLEVGAYTPNQTLIRLRYQRDTRSGTKSTTHWGDTNLVGAPYGTRNIVPGFYDLDETTNTISLDVGNQAQPDQKWNVGTRYSETQLNNKRYNRRRPFENADRIITTKDGTANDLWATHGYYQRTINEKLTVSGGALITKLDTLINGSRIYGQTYDPVFDPAFLRRQQRDEGFYALEGHADMKQTVLNLNAVYTPRKHWTIKPSLRFENLQQETLAEFVETNFGGGAAVPAIIEDVEGEHDKDWDEFAEAIEIRYTGKPNWVFYGEAEWIQGSGSLHEERLIHHTGQKTVDREMDNERSTQKYSLNANWYAKPGLTFAAQYYFKVKVNDYDAVRDNTPVTGGDRYPAFITDQDFETHDMNFRMTWRPLSKLSLVSRYDYQQSTINSIEAGLGQVESSELTAHILSQSVTWSPTARLYLTGNINVTYDQLKTPAYQFVQNGDNNYVNVVIGGGYVLTDRDDLLIDYSLFDASNFSDNSATSLPYNVSQKQEATYVTWKRRQSETLIYTVKYGYVTNRDETWPGVNDFDAHVLYGKVQFIF